MNWETGVIGMEKLLSVQINIVLSIILGILLVHAFFNMNKTLITNRIFMWIMGFTCLCLMLEIIDVFLNTPNIRQLYALHFTINLIGFIVTPSVPYLGCLFMKEWINRFQRERINECKSMYLPLVVNTIAAIASISGHGAFSISKDSIYSRGEIFWVLPTISYFYFAYSLYIIYKYRSKIIRSDQILFSSFYIAISICTAIQLSNGTWFTIWNSSAIICIMMYIFILDDQAYRDALTGLSNRLFYERYIENFNRNKNHNMVAIYIDLDKFKGINDQFGHSEGDDAIRIFALLLKDCFMTKYKKIMRVGGDEFLVIVKEQSLEMVEYYVEKLKREINSFNETKEKPYELNFSYGIAKYDDTYQSITQFFEHTDHLMYGNKQRTMEEINNFS